MEKLLKLKSLKDYFKFYLTAHSEVVFLRSYKIGFPVLILSLLINYNVAVAGMISVLSLFSFVKLIGLKKEFLYSGFYIYNPLLVGMSIGYLYQIGMLSIFFIVVSSILTFLTTLVIGNVLAHYKFPVLSLPFAIVSSLIYLASYNYSNLFTIALYKHQLPWDISCDQYLSLPILSLLKNLGTIFFMPYASMGILVLIILMFYSRILLMLAIVGHFFGVFVHGMLIGSVEQALWNPYSFNYSLVAMALGGVFLVPSRRSYVIAFVGVAISVVLVDATNIFWSTYKLPVFTLPFNVVVIFLVYALIFVNFKYYSHKIMETPEKGLDYFISSLKRFNLSKISIDLPFIDGTWSVYQGFDDEWTHKGKWKHGYDFTIKDDRGNYFEGDPLILSNYYAFKKPVNAPVAGVIVAVENSIPDNLPGSVDHINNWGNYVIIQSKLGFFVEISHFCQSSIKVKVGDVVNLGDEIGLCGNSGMSNVPHIHIQTQLTGYLGDETLDFSFRMISDFDGRIHLNHNPAKGDTVAAIPPEKKMRSLLTLLIGMEFTYKVFVKNKEVDLIKLKVYRDPGSFYELYLSDERGSRLYFSVQNNAFVLHDFRGKDKSSLRLFFLALPRVPFVKAGTWREYIPMNISNTGILKNTKIFMSSFGHGLFNSWGEWTLTDDGVISGWMVKNGTEVKTKASLSEKFWVSSISLGNVRLEKIDDEV